MKKKKSLRKIFIYSLFFSFALANNLEILQNDKKELRNLEKKSIETSYESLKNNWISPIDISSNLNRSHSTSSDNDKFSKSVSIGFTQSIYQSGGIEFSIQYAKDKLKYDLISWKNDNNLLLQSIYETLLEISKLKLEIEQSQYKLENKNIESIIKRIQYEAGTLDIIDLNNAIISKNTQFKENISLQNSLKDKKYELSKYTNLKYEEIEILDFKNISKEDFLKNNLELIQEDSKIEMLNTSYKQTKTDYLPKVSLSSNLSYSHNDDLNMNSDNYGDSSSLGLVLSVPLYDYNKSSKLQESKLEYLKQRIQVNDLKSELSYSYEQILNEIDTYEQYNKTIDENIKIYDDLILINKSSNEAGMTSVYDLDEYDLGINNINIKQLYSKLYFKIKG
jgi:outer membrane protein TolC